MAMSRRNALLMSHKGKYRNPIPQAAQDLRAQQIENDRQNALVMAYSDAPPNALVEAPPLNALLRPVSAYDAALSRWTGPNEALNVQNTLTDVLGSQFAGGGLAAGKAASLGKLGDFFDPRLPMSQVNMTTWHGSPHRINNVTPDAPMGKFSLDKIGTGEGAQAYGSGIYLAESPNVAGSYRDALSGNSMTLDGVATSALRAQRNNPIYSHIDSYHADGMSQPEIVAKLKKDWAHDKQANRRYFTDDQYSDAISSVESAKKIGAEDKGSLYEVDLPDEHIAKMLDWDAPLSEQPQAVKDAITSNPDWVPQNLNEWTGGEYYKRLARESAKKRGLSVNLTDDPAFPGGTSIADAHAIASKRLNDLGIPGIRYFDGTSRKAGEGTRNFVVFDPEKTTKILSRNGENALRAKP